MSAYKMGTRVTFRDPNGNVCHGKDSLASGIVNDEPQTVEGTTFVPVFCARDNGREPTTIYVDERNIVATKEVKP